ncbi:Diacetylchitobiose uptake system permease protein NgcG [subsurface metagenome]
MVISNMRNWVKTKKGQELLGKVFGLIFLSIVVLIILLPLFWMLSTSFKGRAQTFAFPPQWIPNPIKWGNYLKALTIMPFHIYFKNTMIITLGNVIGSVLSCSLVAYGFARLRFPGKNILFIIMLSTLMIPYQITLIPMFILFPSF